MQIQQISKNITAYWPDDSNYELFKSLLFGTVSRSLKGPKERYEFYKNKKDGLEGNAKRFLETNLGFGDESIAEQFNFNLEFHEVPIMFSFEWLYHPYQSPIESSTRYIKLDGSYYYDYPQFSYDFLYDDFISEIKHGMNTYIKAQEPVKKFYEEKFPIESIDWTGVEEENIKTRYDSAIKSKTNDAVKIFLPMSTKTNFTTCLNARALKNLLVELAKSNVQFFGAYDQILMPLIRYVQTDPQTECLFGRLHQSIVDGLKQHQDELTNKVEEVSFTMPDGMSERVAISKLTPHNIPTYPTKRPNRFCKVPEVYRKHLFNVEVYSSLAVIRDLFRQRPPFKEIFSLGSEKWELVAHKDMIDHFPSILNEYKEGSKINELMIAPNPLLKIGAMPLGLKVRWRMYATLYDLSNIVELRSGSGGYWEYIQIARDIATIINKNGLYDNLFLNADMTTNYNETLPTLRQEMKKK